MKRAFTLAVQAGKLHIKPHISMLAEHNVRKGFFEAAQFEAVCRHLSTPIAALRGLPTSPAGAMREDPSRSNGSQVDLQENSITLHADTTKNREPRLIYLGPELRTLIDEQDAERRRLRYTK